MYITCQRMLTNIFQVVLTLQIGMISIIGDKLVENTNDMVSRAAIDNLTHGLVAGVSWTLIVVLFQNSLIDNIPNIVLCAAIASLIDVDHFIEARSWELNAAVHLERRPFLHCTTIPILIWLLLFQISKVYDSQKWENFSSIFLLSFLSHHIRDGARRGLWLAPFGSTKAIPYYPYIIADMILPYIVFLLMNRSTNKFTTHRGITNIV